MVDRNAELDWERSVIATAVHDPTSIVEAEDLLPSDFTGPNQIAWAEVLALHANGGMDYRALVNALRNSQDWTRASGGEPVEGYLTEVMNFRGTQMAAYAQHVVDRSTRRQLRRYAALIAAEAEDNEKRMEEILDFAENKILSLRRNRLDNDLSMADIIGIFIPRMEGMIAGTIQPGWVPNVAAIREIIDYMEEEDLMINAARPGEGKSSWMRWEFYRAARDHQKPVAILNYENAPIEYARYFLAMETRIDSKKLKNPRSMTQEEREAIRDAAQLLARLPIRVVTTPRTISAALSAARKLVASDHIQLLGVDYLQLLNNGVESRVNDLALTTGALRQFSLDYHIPVIANSQLSREIERRGNGENGEGADPQLSDLRESGSLEQDGTVVMFPRPMRTPSGAILSLFPENYENGVLLMNRPRVIPTYFHILKNRNGSTGKSEPVAWYKHLDTYRTLTPGALEGRQ